MNLRLGFVKLIGGKHFHIVEQDPSCFVLLHSLWWLFQGAAEMPLFFILSTFLELAYPKAEYGSIECIDAEDPHIVRAFIYIPTQPITAQ